MVRETKRIGVRPAREATSHLRMARMSSWRGRRAFVGRQMEFGLFRVDS